MLRRDGSLFRAPAGATIQVVAESQNNDDIHASQFEYAREALPGETILDRPGCTFTVADEGERLEAEVEFTDTAPDSARYDLFEVENGVKRPLGKFTKKSDFSNLVGFTIEPDPADTDAAERAATATRRAAPGRRRAAVAIGRKAKKGTARRKAARRKTSARRTGAKQTLARSRRSTAARRKTTGGARRAGKTTRATRKTVGTAAQAAAKRRTGRKTAGAKKRGK
jgi:hypothetical protein